MNRKAFILYGWRKITRPIILILLLIWSVQLAFEVRSSPKFYGYIPLYTTVFILLLVGLEFIKNKAQKAAKAAGIRWPSRFLKLSQKLNFALQLITPFIIAYMVYYYWQAGEFFVAILLVILAIPQTRALIRGHQIPAHSKE